MYIFGVYISIVDFLIVFLGLVCILLLYMAHEINKLKRMMGKTSRMKTPKKRKRRA
jgi:hypothetical protein